MSRLAQWILLSALLGLAGCAHYNKAPVESRAAGRHAGKAPAVHVVRRGDTLFEIAWRYNLDYKRLAAWNGIRKPYIIYPGQRLRLHPSRSRPASGGHSARPKPAIAQKPRQGKASPSRKTRPRPSPQARKLHWIWPAEGEVVHRFVANSPVNKGIRIAGRAGRTIRTAESGKVVYAGSGLRGYGKLIIIKHNSNYLSAYGFNRRLLVKDKQKVTKGQKIAEMGVAPDGRAMLHFEIRRNGRPVDPLTLLPR